MRIGIDAKRAVANRTGLGNYSRMVVEALASADPSCEILLYSASDNPGLAAPLLQKYPNIRMRPPTGLWKYSGSLWRTFGISSLLRLDGVDVFHGLSHELPVGIDNVSDILRVLTVHDLIFLRYPQFYNPIDVRIYTQKIRYACRAADKIVAISRRTRDDLIELLDIPSAKIEVIYQGCAPTFAQALPENVLQQLRQKYKLPAHFLLQVGTIEARKNLITAVRAVQYLPDDVVLVAIGKRTPYQETVEKEITRLGLSGRVRIFNQIDHAELHAFYHCATLFLYPSLYEGFGIPLIEALSAGLPVVAAQGSCLEEAAGEGGIYLSSTEPIEWGNAINQLLDNPSFCTTMVQKGQEHIRQFATSNIASRLISIYNTYN